MKNRTNLGCNTIGIKTDARGVECWDFGDERESLMHRIHAFPAKFPAFITKKAVTHAQASGIKVKRIADVFCGCGTTALEAKRMNANFWGCDINPVATLITRVKIADYQPERLRRYTSVILSSYSRRKGLQHALQQDDERLCYWYSDKQILALARLKAAISIIPVGKYRDFFLCAFSNILKPTSRWLTKSIKPQIDPYKHPADVRNAFEKQVGFMFKALHKSDKVKPSDSVIKTGNFLSMEFPEPIADMVVTSPPYVTSYEYADLHQLSTLWLGYTNDYRKLRRGTIGSLYHDSDFNRNIRQLNKTGNGIVFQLYDVDNRKARATAKYFADLSKAVKQCRRLITPGGMILFVIGNTEYKGVKIDNAKYLAECLLEDGFTRIETSMRKVSSKILTPYRDACGKFTSDSSSRKVYAEEYILSGRNT